jgi:predicted integral membrane protein DUF2269
VAARTIRAVPLLAIVLPIHIALAIALFVPALLLPFALRTDRPATESRSRLVRFLLRMQGGGSVLIGIGLVVTGALLVGSLGLTIVDQPWLLVALAIYALNLGIALFIQRPNLRALVGLRAAWDDRTWLAAARRQRYVSYAMAGLIGLIGYLMSAKPQL